MVSRTAAAGWIAAVTSHGVGACGETASPTRLKSGVSALVIGSGIWQRWDIVSIYSELLGRLCGDLDPVRLPSSRGDVVVVLLQCRRRRRSHRSGKRHDLAEDLALELEHDRTLVRLCSSLGIETDTELFASPLPERERLEGLLCEAGVDFWALADNRRGDLS
jgi:hypothetical protein